MSKKIRIEIKTSFNKKQGDIAKLEDFGAKQISNQKRKNGDLFIIFSITPENEEKFIEFAKKQKWEQSKI